MQRTFIHLLFISYKVFMYTLFFYKNIFYKNIEAEICEILRIFVFVKSRYNFVC